MGATSMGATSMGATAMGAAAVGATAMGGGVAEWCPGEDSNFHEQSPTRT